MATALGLKELRALGHPGGRVLLLACQACGAAPRVALAACGAGQAPGLEDAQGAAALLALAALGAAEGEAGALLAGEGVAELVEALAPAACGGEALPEARLKELDGRLAARTFLCGGAGLTLADVVAFGAVHPALEGALAAQARARGAAFPYRHLARWFDLVQHTVDVGGVYPKVPLVPTVGAPPALAAPSAAPRGGKGDEKGEKGKKGKGAAAGGGAPGKPAGGPAERAAKAPAAADGAAAAAGGKKKKEKKAKEPKPAKQPAAKREVDVSLLLIKVGKILKAWEHPEADALYVEEIDVGEAKPRQIVSGLRKFVPMERMQGLPCLVLCNMKPAKMRGIESSGMVLCASDADHTAVDPVSPPEGAAPGEVVTFAGFDGEPEERLNPKKKQFDKIAPDLRTDAAGVPNYKGVPFMTSKGPCTATIKDAFVK